MGIQCKSYPYHLTEYHNKDKNEKANCPICNIPYAINYLRRHFKSHNLIQEIQENIQTQSSEMNTNEDHDLPRLEILSDLPPTGNDFDFIGNFIYFRITFSSLFIYLKFYLKY